jgi:hypothetical protein
MCKRIDLAWMIRTKRAVPGSLVSGTLWWTCGGESAGSISYVADMCDPENAFLRLSYTRGSGSDQENVQQLVRLTYTEPNYGGRRWWMVCPYRHNRCGKLYLPNGGDRFRRATRVEARLSLPTGGATRSSISRNSFASKRSWTATKGGKRASHAPRGCGIAHTNAIGSDIGTWMPNAQLR